MNQAFTNINITTEIVPVEPEQQQLEVKPALSPSRLKRFMEYYMEAIAALILMGWSLDDMDFTKRPRTTHRDSHTINSRMGEVLHRFMAAKRRPRSRSLRARYRRAMQRLHQVLEVKCSWSPR